MRKKLYDFSVSTAVIVLLAYAFLITFALFTVFNDKSTYWPGIIISILLVISLLMVVWYYIFLAVTVSDKGISHGKKFIDRKDVKWRIEYNRLLHYDEIIIYDRYVNDDKLSKKEQKRKQIVVQYFLRSETLLKEYFAKGIDNEGK